MTLAIVFPGQGSQSIGMMSGFAGHPIVRATFDEASRALGDDLWHAANHARDAELSRYPTIKMIGPSQLPT